MNICQTPPHTSPLSPCCALHHFLLCCATLTLHISNKKENRKANPQLVDTLRHSQVATLAACLLLLYLLLIILFSSRLAPASARSSDNIVLRFVLLLFDSCAPGNPIRLLCWPGNSKLPNRLVFPCKTQLYREQTFIDSEVGGKACVYISAARETFRIIKISFLSCRTPILESIEASSVLFSKERPKSLILVPCLRTTQRQFSHHQSP